MYFIRTHVSTFVELYVKFAARGTLLFGSDWPRIQKIFNKGSEKLTTPTLKYLPPIIPTDVNCCNLLGKCGEAIWVGPNPRHQVVIREGDREQDYGHQ